MSKSLAHRGPDQDGVWSSFDHRHSVGLAHRRLAIRDLTDAGKQPMVSHTGRFILVFNGELYNDGAIARQLERYRDFVSRSSSDSEILLESIARIGPQSISSFNGIYAFAVYDQVTRDLLLARDPLGVKPLYYWRDPAKKAFAFASEVKAFLSIPHFERKIDPRSLSALLAQGYVGPSRSLMQDVVSVSPGQVLRISAEGNISECFSFEPFFGASQNDRIRSTKHAASILKNKFEDAVTRQRVSDVPLAVWQSGGVDSALVNAACREPRPYSLTLSTGHGDFDEAVDAKRVADYLNSELTTVELGEETDLTDTFSSLVWHMDGELADSSALAVRKLSAATKKRATVVLSGDGADEVFGGYATYRATKLASSLGRASMAGPLHAISRQMFAFESSGSRRYPTIEWAARLLQGLPKGYAAHAEWRRYAMPWQLREILAPTLSERVDQSLQDYVAAIEKARSVSPDAAGVEWAQSADITHYLPGDMLMKVDRMSMAHGLEVRVPFLDLEFLATLGQVDPNLRLPRMTQTKPLLREMLKQYGFAQKIVNRKKTGFNVPLAHQLRTQFATTLQSLLLNGDLLQPFLRPEYVARLVNEHLRGSANHSYLLWSIMTFAQWRSHIGR